MPVSTMATPHSFSNKTEPALSPPNQVLPVQERQNKQISVWDAENKVTGKNGAQKLFNPTKQTVEGNLISKSDLTDLSEMHPVL